MTIPQKMVHRLPKVTLFWRSMGPIPLMSCEEVAAALGRSNRAVQEHYLDYCTHSPHCHTAALWESEDGELCYEFDALWDFLKEEGFTDLWQELFGCEK